MQELYENYLHEQFATDRDTMMEHSILQIVFTRGTKFFEIDYGITFSE